MNGWWIYVGHGGGLAALEARDPDRRPAHLQPVELRARPLLPRARARPARSRSTSGGARCRRGSCSRSRSSSAARSPILSRLKLLRARRSASGSRSPSAVAVLAATGHTIIARWHLGPISGAYLWRVLLTSPEILVFLFFMITDPRTTPRGQRARARVRRVRRPARGAPDRAAADGVRDEGRRSSPRSTVVCAARPLVERAAARAHLGRRRLALVGVAALAVYAGALVTGGIVGRAPATGDGGVRHRAGCRRSRSSRRRASTASSNEKTSQADRRRPRRRPPGRRPRALCRAARRRARAGHDRRRAERADAAGRAPPRRGPIEVPAYRVRPDPPAPRGRPRPGPGDRRRRARRNDAA